MLVRNAEPFLLNSGVMKNHSRQFGLASFLVLALSSNAALAQMEPGQIRSDLERGSGVPSSAKASLQKFYGDRGYEPAFVRNGQVTSLVAELKAAITAIAPAHGLSPKDYWTPNLEALSIAVPLPANAEYLFAKAYVDLAIHLQTGRIAPDRISNDIKYTRQTFTGWDAIRAGAMNQGLASALESVAPRHAGYRKLVKALARMREVEARGGFKPLKISSSLKVGSSSPVVKEIKTRVAAMGYAVASIDSKFDSQLSTIIADIQESNLASPSGRISTSDSATLEWFSVSSTRRIQQLEMNLEKYRWLPSELESRHIFINLATQHLYLVDPTNTIESLKDMRVINGRPDRKTPSMRDATTSVVFNPKWTVPPTVFAEDKVTALQKISQTEGAYGIENWFSKGRYTVVDDELRRQISPSSVDWMNLNPKTANFYIVQLPGYDNALGVVKVMLGNPWAIYLHDTNDRDLFSNAMRARSSGCIRMQRPLDMAEYLLRGTKWNRPAIDAYVPHDSFEMKEKESWVKLPESNKLPVYTMSLTARLGDDNVIRFTQDVYKQNAAILAALQSAGFAK
jgi:L,D-transpeptidase YcbB